MSDTERPLVGVGIIVFRNVGGKPHIMLHQRKGPFGTNYWGSGGGKLDLGESLMAGALRELREEAGDTMQVANVRFLGILNFTEMKPKHFVDASFAADWVSGEPENTEPDKMTEWQWFPLGNLPSPLFPPVATYLEAAATGKNFFDSSF